MCFYKLRRSELFSTYGTNFLISRIQICFPKPYPDLEAALNVDPWGSGSAKLLTVHNLHRWSFIPPPRYC